MLRLLAFVFKSAFFLSLAYICIINQQLASFSILHDYSLEMPVYVLILIVFMLGFFMAWAEKSFRIISLKISNKSLSSKLDKLQKSDD